MYRVALIMYRVALIMYQAEVILYQAALTVNQAAVIMYQVSVPEKCLVRAYVRSTDGGKVRNYEAYANIYVSGLHVPKSVEDFMLERNLLSLPKPNVACLLCGSRFTIQTKQ